MYRSTAAARVQAWEALHKSTARYWEEQCSGGSDQVDMAMGQQLDAAPALEFCNTCLIQIK